MIQSAKFLKFSLLILALGLGFKAWRSRQAQTPIKSVEQYWSETGLVSSQLENLIDDVTCATSQRYFLACANSMINIANRFNLQVTLDGQLKPADAFSRLNLTEKKQLEPWKEFYNQRTAQASKISFVNIWKTLQARKITGQQKAMMISLGLNGFISVFRDPHTYLMPIAMFREVVSQADNQSSSLGIILGRAETHYFIRKVYPGAPSEKMGLKKGDLVLEVNGRSIAGLLPGKVGELLRGEVGQKIQLRIERDGFKKDVTVYREQKTLATVTARVLEGLKPVGLLTINKFAKQSCLKTKQALIELKQQGVRGLMLDLRDNPGGQMEEAACVASLFVGPEHKIFDVRYLDPSREVESTYGSEQKIYEGPVAILINSGSASASEIVAGALQDLNRAILVGEKSFGKGSFQEGEVWGENKKIAIFETKGFYYLPSGRSPQMKGLEPDVKVNFKDTLQAREMDQYVNPLRAPEKLLKAAPMTKISMQDCLDIEDSNLNTEDPQLGQARVALFCKPNVAGVNP